MVVRSCRDGFVVIVLPTVACRNKFTINQLDFLDIKSNNWWLSFWLLIQKVLAAGDTNYSLLWMSPKWPHNLSFLLQDQPTISPPTAHTLFYCSIQCDTSWLPVIPPYIWAVPVTHSNTNSGVSGSGTVHSRDSSLPMRTAKALREAEKMLQLQIQRECQCFPEIVREFAGNPALIGG